MGMTDTQFKSYVRLLLKDLKSVLQEPTVEEKNAKVQELIASLQDTLED